MMDTSVNPSLSNASRTAPIRPSIMSSETIGKGKRLSMIVIFSVVDDLFWRFEIKNLSYDVGNIWTKQKRINLLFIYPERFIYKEGGRERFTDEPAWGYLANSNFFTFHFGNSLRWMFLMTSIDTIIVAIILVVVLLLLFLLLLLCHYYYNDSRTRRSHNVGASSGLHDRLLL